MSKVVLMGKGGSISDAVRERKRFDSLDELIEYVVDDANKFLAGISRKNLTINFWQHDERVPADKYHILTDRFGEEYERPQYLASFYYEDEHQEEIKKMTQKDIEYAVGIIGEWYRPELKGEKESEE